MRAPVATGHFSAGVLTVEWSAVAGASGYEVVVRTANGALAASATPTSTATTCEFRALAANTAYLVRVRATGGRWSVPVSITTEAVAAPAGTVSAEPGALLVTLTGTGLVDLTVLSGATEITTGSGTAGTDVTLPGVYLAGTTYQVTGRAWSGNAASAPATIGSVTVRDVPAPALALTHAGGTVTGTWTQVAEETYEFELWTGDTRVTHQPTATSPVRVDSGIAADKTYEGRVRAWRDRNASAWATATVSTAVLDARIAALRDRLDTAKGVVNATSLGTDGADIATLIRTQLGTDAVPFADPVSTTDPVADTLTLTGTAAVLGMTGARLTAEFGVAAIGLTLRLRITTPDGWKLSTSVPALAGTLLTTVAFDPGAVFVLDGTGLTFTGAALLTGPLAPVTTLGTGLPARVPVTGPVRRDAGEITLTGPVGSPVAITIPAGQRLAFGNPRLVLSHTWLGLRDEVQLGGVRLSLDIMLPSAARPWRIALATAGVPVTALPAFLAVCPGVELGKALPADVSALTSFAVTGLAIDLDREATTLVGFQVAVGPAEGAAPLWTVLPGVLEVAALRVTLSVRWPAGAPKITGRITGTFRLGDRMHTTVSLPIPLDASEWLFGMSGAGILPDLGGFATLLGGAELATLLPAGVAEVGGFDLTGLAVTYSPSTNTLTSLDLVLDSAKDWPLVPGRLVMSKVHVAIHVTAPLDGKARQTSGAVSGTLVLADTVRVGIAVTKIGDAWFTEVGVDAVRLPSLGVLTTLLGGTSAADLVPKRLRDASFTLQSLQVLATLAPNAGVTLVSFSLTSTDNWPVVDGVSVRAPWLMLTLDWRSGKLVTTGALGGVFRIADAELSATAGYQNGWTIDAKLLEPAKVPLSGLLSHFRAEPVSLPGHGLPTLEFTELTAQVVPGGEVTVTLGSALRWPVEFGTGTDPMRIAGLGVLFRRLSDGTPATVVLTGTLAYHGLAGSVTLALGGPTARKLLVVTVTPGTAAIALEAMANALATTKGAEWNTLPLPADFTPGTLDGAGMELDLTAGTLVLYGKSTKYGASAGLLVRSADGAWRYAVGVAVNTASSVSQGLAPADAFFGLTGASAVIVVVSANATDLAPLVARIPELARVTGAMGLNLAARLTFAGPVLGNVPKILPGSDNPTDKPALMLRALVTQPSANSWFEATLDRYTLAGAVEFTGVVLRWTPSAKDTLILRGTMAVAVGGHTYSFAGDLTVTSTAATFSVTTTQKIPAPLGMTGIDLNAAALSVGYTFPGGDVTIRLSGAVTIGSVTGLTGFLHLTNGTPVLVRVAVTGFRLTDLFQQSVGKPWPATEFDPLVIDTGEVYYCAQTAGMTFDGRTYLHGFNVAARLRILGIAATLSLTVNPTKGVTATGALDKPVELGFARLTAASVTLTTIDAPAFILRAGLTLLEADLGSVAMTVRKDVARVQVRPNLPVFGPVSFTVCWSQARGLYFDGFPINLDAAFEILNLLSQTGSCAGKQILAALPIKTKYDCTSSWTITAGSLEIILEGHFNLSTADQRLLRIDLQRLKISVALPKAGFGWSKIPELIGQTIRDNAYSIFRQVLSDPASMAMLLAIEGVRYAAGALIDALVCEDWARQAATTFVQAAGGAFATSVTGSGGTAVVVGGVGVSVGVGGVVVVGGGGGASPPAKPGDLTATYAGGTLTMGWGAARDADRYAWRLLGPTGATVAGETGTARQATVAGSALTWGSSHQLEVRGLRGGVLGPIATLAVPVPSPGSIARESSAPHTAATRIRTDFPTVTARQVIDAFSQFTDPGALAVVLKAAGFALTEANAALSDPIVADVYTSAWWAAAETARAAGTPVEQAGVAVRASSATATQAVAALTGTWFLTTIAAGLTPVATALKAAGYPLGEVVTGLKARYGTTFTPASYGTVLRLFNKETP